MFPKSSLLFSFIIITLSVFNCSTLKPGEKVLLGAMQNDYNMVKTGVDENEDVNSVNEKGNTALMWAVYHGSGSIFKLLTDKGAKLAAKDSYNQTVLEIAALAESSEAAKGDLAGEKASEGTYSQRRLIEMYKKEIECDFWKKTWEYMQNMFGGNTCISLDRDMNEQIKKSQSEGKDADKIIEKLKGYAKPDIGPKVNLSKVSRISLIPDLQETPPDAVAFNRNMSQNERYREYLKLAEKYEREGNSSTNSIAKDPFSECSLPGPLELEPLQKTEKRKFDAEHRKFKISPSEDPDMTEENWLSLDQHQRVRIKSLEDWHKFRLLKRKVKEYVLEIFKYNAEFAKYQEIASQKVTEKDYQKMAEFAGKIARYKADTLIAKTGTDAGKCNLKAFVNYTDKVKKISSQLASDLELISKRKSESSILERIESDANLEKSVEADCNTLLGMPNPDIKFSQKDLGRTFNWCYYSALKNSTSNSAAFYNAANKYGDSNSRRDLEEMKSRSDKGEKNINKPSLGSVEKKITPLDGHPYQKYKMGVLTFIDQTLSRRAELARYALADILTSELFLTNRFSMMDREEIVQIEKIKDTVYVPTKTKREETVPPPVTLKSSEKKEGTEAEKDVETKIKTPEPIQSAENLYTIDKSTDALREKTSTDRDKFNAKSVDGFLYGYITSVDFPKGELFVDYRIVYPHNKEAAHQEFGNLIVFAGSQKIHFNYDEKHELITFNRDDLRAIATDILAGFADTKTVNELLVNESEAGLSLRSSPDRKDLDPTAGKKTLKLLKVEGDTIIINAGAAHGIRHGYVGYIASQYDYETYNYVAKFVVENVFERSSKCTVTKGLENIGSLNEGAHDLDVLLK